MFELDASREREFWFQSRQLVKVWPDLSNETDLDEDQRVLALGLSSSQWHDLDLFNSQLEST